MNKQKGFSLVVVLLAVLVACAVAGAGYYVYSAQKKTEPEPTEQTTIIKKTDTEPAQTTKEGWNTYTNTEFGYSLEYPAVQVTNACIKTSKGYDNYGNEIALLPEHYGAETTNGKMVVVQSSTKGKIYITAEKTALLSNEKKSTNYLDRDIFMSCEDAPASAKLLDNGLTDSAKSYSFTNMNATFIKTNEAGIPEAIKRIYPTQGLTVKLGDVNNNGVQLVTPSKYLTNALVLIQYIPKNETLVIWGGRQSCVFSLGEACVDEQVTNSLKGI